MTVSRSATALGVAAVVALSAPLAQAGDKPAASRARTDYILHCSGCHGLDGSGHPQKGVPEFRGQVGYFQLLPEGRAFLMQVPGLLSAGLSDERAAAVTTWLVLEFAGPSLQRDFVAYTAQEARGYRESRPADIAGARRALYQRLSAAGYQVNR